MYQCMCVYQLYVCVCGRLGKNRIVCKGKWDVRGVIFNMKLSPQTNL